ncbi:MAG: AAA family ATPase [Magnetococcales bacterium]|nr:AAA family ATPase [Magnetococcales bacterium]
MRILRIQCKNLNSLVGEWQIDLQHPSFCHEPLFAITGPTGAGKSTLLDAICLALYGRTPRLSRLSKSGNEIMSRRCGDCYAEVEFRTAEGHFQAQWSQRRSRGRADGELQPPRHRLEQLDGEKRVIAESLREVAAAIEQKTGLDFDRFSRAMLLAQGQFAAFLQATADERAPILEQITGTEIYSTLSIKVHERRALELRQKEELARAVAEIRCLSSEEEQGLQQERESLQQQLAVLQQQLIDSEQGLQWWALLARLQQEEQQLSGRHADWQQRRVAFRADEARLQAALRAMELSAEQAALRARRQQRLQTEGRLQRLLTQRPGQMIRQQQRTEALHKTEQALTDYRQEAAQQRALIEQVRQQDQLLQALWRPVAAGEQSLRKAKESLHRLQEQIAQQEKRRNTVADRLQQLNQQQSQAAGEQALAGELTGIEQRFLQLRQVLEQPPCTATGQETAQVGNESVAELQRRLQQLQSSLPWQTEKRRLVQEQLILQEREWAMLQQIANLQEARQQLRPGEACPLCGALEHPYVAADLPAPDGAWQRLQQLRQQLQQQQTLLESLHQQEAWLIWLLQRQQALESAQQLVAPFGLTLTVASPLANLLQNLQKRCRQWQEREEERQRLANEQSVLAATLQQQQQQQQQWQMQIAQDESRLHGMRQEWSELQSERQRLFGAEDPQQRQQALEAQGKERETQQQQARQAWQEGSKALAVLDHEVAGLQSDLQQGESLWRHQEERLQQRLQEAGFVDESHWHSASLSEAQRTALQGQLQQLTEEEHHLLRRRTEVRQQLQQAQETAVTGESAEKLQTLRQSLLESQQSLQQQWGAIEQRLLDQAQQRDERQRRQQSWQQQQQACARWEMLHTLIGSADGKKFRNFAQGLTFERVVRQANRQLLRLNDRYQLCRDAQQPLELNVVDLYQAGEVRSSRNLSGGESFVVSLALALGLAQLPGQRIQVDSLFLDEGFGTLDENALQTALESLATLQQEGKQIGIISHIAALRERIPAQIFIQPQGGGRSIITGPGCEKLSSGKTTRLSTQDRILPTSQNM